MSLAAAFYDDEFSAEDEQLLDDIFPDYDIDDEFDLDDCVDQSYDGLSAYDLFGPIDINS